jgi:hypothetical protein
MAGQPISCSADFETLIAKAGFTKDRLAREAGISRAVIFRAINPRGYPNTSGQLRERTAWAITKAYARAIGIDEQVAFDRLFVVEEQPRQDAIEHAAVEDIPTPEPEAEPQSARRSTPPTSAAQLDRNAQGPTQTIGVRLDANTARMLEVLMEDEDRSTKGEMIRVLIKRAYRALAAQRAAIEGTIP